MEDKNFMNPGAFTDSVPIHPSGECSLKLWNDTFRVSHDPAPWLPVLV